MVSETRSSPLLSRVSCFGGGDPLGEAPERLVEACGKPPSSPLPEDEPTFSPSSPFKKLKDSVGCLPDGRGSTKVVDVPPLVSFTEEPLGKIVMTESPPHSVGNAAERSPQLLLDAKDASESSNCSPQTKACVVERHEVTGDAGDNTGAKDKVGTVNANVNDAAAAADALGVGSAADAHADDREGVLTPMAHPEQAVTCDGIVPTGDAEEVSKTKPKPVEPLEPMGVKVLATHVVMRPTMPATGCSPARRPLSASATRPLRPVPPRENVRSSSLAVADSGAPLALRPMPPAKRRPVCRPDATTALKMSGENSANESLLSDGVGESPKGGTTATAVVGSSSFSSTPNIQRARSVSGVNAKCGRRRRSTRLPSSSSCSSCRDTGENNPSRSSSFDCSSKSAYKSGSFSGPSSLTITSSESRNTSVSDSSSSLGSGKGTPEAIPLKPGCVEPPPFAAFADLHCRFNLRSHLDLYAEPAVVHEWNTSVGRWIAVQTSVVIFPTPFAYGNMRASYYVIDLNRLNCMMVAKRYLRSSIKQSQYFDDVSMHTIANHWARRFNCCMPPKSVHFVPAAVLELTDRHPPMFFAAEPKLEGNFIKYNNNNGYVTKESRWTPQAFSHFTYHASDKKLMIVDIQGVNDIYTDPQILTLDGKGYGRGNLGKKGMRLFLRSHVCNDVCRTVGLPRISHGRVRGDELLGISSSPVFPPALYCPAAPEILPPRSNGPRATTPSVVSSAQLGGSGASSAACNLASPPARAETRGGTGLLQRMRVYVSRRIFRRKSHNRKITEDSGSLRDSSNKHLSQNTTSGEQSTPALSSFSCSCPRRP
ncbi:myosin heavy chain kinase c-like protein [Trypanosoma grayi]|uniref:myosin heavy chain kinase c-like protein n=1 Tax=Trypanosoma grayi TaxID=71804 RepID=UPI0004F42CB4|nr:myosin heavy chain kinase c-like protein [Trypanosoma grayi]KEG14198.1 myosin heavy chain kinase c-like protein [Trypanosoma grayi]